MVPLRQLVEYANNLLDIAQFQDYAPNGLQVEGGSDVGKIVSGVTASLDLIEAAIKQRADVLLVHHGYFWKGEDPCITGMKHLRVKRLLTSGISLMAYHIPLDAHSRYGNNVQLARKLDFRINTQRNQEENGSLVMYGTLSKPMNACDLGAHISEHLGRTPLHITGRPSLIRNIAWCTGAAQGYFAEAVAEGVDAYITGEVSEQTTHIARERGVHFFGAGHHATERYGVQALGEHLAEKFSLKHEFIDIDNPV